MVGTALSKILIERGYDVIVLTRRIPDEKFQNVNSKFQVRYALWDVAKQTIDKSAVAKADFIIHLAGANVAEKRWTKKRKQEIVDSRVKSGELIVKAVKEIPNNIKAVVSASAIGWYRADNTNEQKPFVETDLPADDFLGKTCQQWEAAIQPVEDLAKRLVILRTGIVLSDEGGAYAEFKKPLKFGVATILGSGKQIISWIHIDDLIRMYIEAIENESLQGVYNAVAPNPVSNKELILEMARQRKRLYLPVYVPAFALKTILGEMSIEVLKSAKVSSEKIQREGFQFLYSNISEVVGCLTPTHSKGEDHQQHKAQ